MKLVWIVNIANEQDMLTFSELEIMVLMKIKNVFFKLCLHKKKKKKTFIAAITD